MIRFLAASVSGILFAGLSAAQTPSKVDFRRDIQPIFQERCIGCHGPSQQSGDMRLDRRSSAMQARGSVRLGPGNAEGSKLYLRVAGTRYGTRMPPTGALTPEQINLIKTWIDQGADWPDELSGDKSSSPPDPGAARMMEALRNGDRQTFARMLRDEPEAVNQKGPGGSTPLMYVALYGDADAVEQLVGRGVDVNISNEAGATALMWALEDVTKTRLLLEHGADPNSVSVERRTPLGIALRRIGSAPVVKLLLEHGAKTVATSGSRNPLAGVGADATVLRLLLDNGVEAGKLAPGLSAAVNSGCAPCIDLLLKNADKSTLNDALTSAVGMGDTSTVALLLDRGADPKVATSDDGIPALLYAAGSEIAHPDIVKPLIEHDADVNAKTAEGATALDFASRQGGTAVTDVLRKAGAMNGEASTAPFLKPKAAVSVRAALDRTLPLLQRNDVTFLRKAGCVSCHNNSLTAMTVAAARTHGLPVDEKTAQTQREGIAAYLEGARERTLQGSPLAGGADTEGYILLGLAAENWPADPATDAAARYLKSQQNADGSWKDFGTRPPIESSDFQCTATAMRSLMVYMPKTQRAEYEKSVQQAAEWLAHAHPKTTEDRAFQLLGFAWVGGKQKPMNQAAKDLMREQRPDGGWAQLPTLQSDAYATGQALVALREAGALKPSNAVYKRGVQFLMETQLEDGSWYVRSRTIPFQPYFDIGFPYGYDQFISAAATNWAAMALIPVAR